MEQKLINTTIYTVQKNPFTGSDIQFTLLIVYRYQPCLIGNGEVEFRKYIINRERWRSTRSPTWCIHQANSVTWLLLKEFSHGSLPDVFLYFGIDQWKHAPARLFGWCYSFDLTCWIAQYITCEIQMTIENSSVTAGAAIKQWCKTPVWWVISLWSILICDHWDLFSPNIFITLK